ncbi:hypothetical protein BJ508DRAFT_377579 [Ascobolus immersus RN42]|uniref:Uncharacterized protein n=1 Tax=Ascobolus immersus RN42 TaxID=1160509 RepID=A0A3N4I5Z5_ASCIM|nr:hypothetical protein BJ508DRAFT_377579 [Ascobolus immersus RN42]
MASMNGTRRSHGGADSQADKKAIKTGRYLSSLCNALSFPRKLERRYSYFVSLSESLKKKEKKKKMVSDNGSNWETNTPLIIGCHKLGSSSMSAELPPNSTMSISVFFTEAGASVQLFCFSKREFEKEGKKEKDGQRQRIELGNQFASYHWMPQAGFILHVRLTGSQLDHIPVAATTYN